MVFMTLSPPALSIAEDEMYWGQAPPTSAEITDKDFSIDFDKTQQSPTFGDQEIYDTYKTKDLTSEAQPEAGPAIRSSTPIQPEPVVRTAPPPIRTNISVPTSTQRSTPSQKAPSVSPKPAETSPGSTPPTTNANSSVNGNVGSSTTDQDDQDRPATKKMKWGQTESNSEQSQTKFQWGKQNQQD